MTLLRVLWVALLLINSGVAAEPINSKDPEKLVKQLATQTLNKINQSPELLSERSALRGLLEQSLLPYIDYKYAAYKVIGPAIRETTKEQRGNFSEAFKDYMVGSFTVLFKQYDPKRHVLIFDPVRIEGQVPARFVSEGKPDISLIFYLRQNRKTKEWNVYDLAAEGISQVETKHKEFKPLIRQRGIDYVTAQLNEKVKNGLSETDVSGLPNEQAQ